MSISVEQEEGYRVIRLDGEIGIACAAELKAALLDAIAAGRDVRVALAGAADLDVTAVQLLWAARRAAGNAGTRLAFAENLSPRAAAALAGAGFNDVPELACRD